MAWTIRPPQDEIAFLMESGVICREALRIAEAEDIFKGVRALLPSSETPEVMLGTVRFHAGDLDGAIKHFQRALAIQPNSALALAHLGEAQIYKLDRAGATASLEKALKLDPRGETGAMVRGLLELLAKKLPA